MPAFNGPIAADHVTAGNGLLGTFVALRPVLLRYLTARGAGVSEAEDVLQDVYLTLHETAPAPVSQPKFYMYRTSLNRLRDHRRADVRRNQRERSWIEANGGQTIEEDSSPSAETELIGRDLLSIVQHHLAKLPERSATIFLRFRVDGEAQRTIAADLGISLSGVEKHLQAAYRAVTAIKASLNAEPTIPKSLIA